MSIIYTTDPTHIDRACVIASASAIIGFCAAYLATGAPHLSFERFVLVLAVVASCASFLLSVAVIILCLYSLGWDPEPDGGLPVEIETTPCDARSRNLLDYITRRHCRPSSSSSCRFRRAVF